MGRPKNNGWNHPDSEIYVDANDERSVIYGTYIFFDHKTRFRVTEQINSKYAGRGTLSLISPYDDHILQVRGQEKRERMKSASDDERARAIAGKRLERLNATRAIYVSEMDKSAVMKAVEDAAAELLSKNMITLREITTRNAASHEAGVMQVVYQFKDSFINRCYQGRVPKTKAKHKRTLEKAGEVLADTPLNNILQPDVARLEKNLGPNPRPQLRLLSEFWQYCRSKRLCSGENPFAQYLENQTGPKKTAKTMQRKAMTFTALPDKETEKIDELVYENRTDGRYMGVVLAKEAHIASKDAAQLTWDDIIFMDGSPSYARVRLRRDEITGATHDFTRPVFPYGAAMLARRFDHLKETYTDEKLRTMPIVSGGTNPVKKMQAKDITAFCTNVLFKAGMKSRSMLPDKNTQHGAGIQLLLSDYCGRLKEQCGLSPGDAVYKFLCGTSLSGDVTADHYRSFTCPEGQWHIYRVLCRDGRKLSGAHGIHDASGGGTGPAGSNPVYGIGQPGMLMDMSFTVTMKAGEKLCISSPGGVEASFEVMKSKGGRR